LPTLEQRWQSAPLTDFQQNGLIDVDSCTKVPVAVKLQFFKIATFSNPEPNDS